MFLKVDASFRNEFKDEMPVGAIALACTTVRFTAVVQTVITDLINCSISILGNGPN
jgi:hypothetical protein